MQMKRTDMWVQVGKEWAGGIKRVALTYIHYHESNRAGETLLFSTGSSAQCSGMA